MSTTRKSPVYRKPVDGAFACCRLKAKFELTFEQPEKVYRFFDFAAAEYSRKTQKKAAKKADSAVAPVSSGLAC
ncbi:hypothetical protein [Hymenobacter antarcticus]|uniref:Transposase n=1 Tax=Hymenobacter antarcticus TaxID=486270 RepID=A0ABP7P7P9_9BACT